MDDKLCSGYGQFHSPNNPKNPQDYVGITLNEIAKKLHDPPSVPKDQAQWVIGSTLKSRVHQEQRERGRFSFVWSDVDETKGLTVNDIVERVTDFLGADFMIYTSRSATEAQQKCRLIVPLSEPISGDQFVIQQKLLNDKLEAAGITPDRATERAGQICYLPNRGEFYKSLYMDHLGSFSPAFVVEEEEQKQDRSNTGQYRTDSTVREYNETHRLPQVLESYGYPLRGKKWLSPNSKSGVPGVTITDDGQKWLSAHSSDSGMGRATKNGTMGDAFDLFVYYEHGGDFTAALKALGSNTETYSGASQRHNTGNVEGRKGVSMDVSANVREYLLDGHGGAFKVSDLKRELALNDKQYAVARNCVSRMVKQGELEKHGHALGCYRVVDTKKSVIDWDATEAKASDILLPAELHEVATIREGDMVAVAGYKNHAKSAFAIETVKLNLDRFLVHFHITEYAARMKQRLLDFGVDLHHPNLFCYQIEKSDYIPDKIEPGEGALNVIDHLPNLDNFYLVGKTQDEIHRTLDGGLCVITHQKKNADDLDAIGGSFWTITPTLAVTLFMEELSAYPGRMLIRKGKEPGNGHSNITGLNIRYELASGCRYRFAATGWTK